MSGLVNPGRRRSSGRIGSGLVRRSMAMALTLLIVFGVDVSLTAGAAAAAYAQAPTATPASGGSIGIRIVEIPVDVKDDPRAHIYIVDRLAPGTTIQRRIAVSNTTPAAAEVALYPAAASIVSGQFTGASGHTQNLLSSWVSITPTAPVVPAGKESTATVTIAVPKDAAPGESYGVIWAEVRPAGASGAGTGGAAVEQISRVGIRIYLSVGPGNAPASNFSIGSVTAERSKSGQPLVVTQVQNTGGRALDMTGSLQLTNGPGGLSAGPFPVTLGTTLAVGATSPVTTALSEALPAGPWVATITLRSGTLMTSAKGIITFPVSGSAAAVSTVGDQTSSSQAWIYVVIGIVLVLTIVGILLWGRVAKRRRRGKSATRSGPAHSRK